MRHLEPAGSQIVPQATAHRHEAEAVRVTSNVCFKHHDQTKR